MFHRWAALALVLALCALAPKHAAGQRSSLPRGRKAGTLGQNYPNPANPQTTIPFTVGDDSCAGGEGGGPQHVVTIRIYNILSQLVAVPKLRTAAGGPDSSSTIARPVQGLRLTCGAYSAFWDGRHMNTGRDVPAGTYVYELVIDGQREVKKMLVGK
jgi:hypothetical protein